MSIAGFDFPDESGGQRAIDAVDERQAHELTPLQLASILTLIGFGVGVLWRLATFFRGFGPRVKPAAGQGSD